MIFAIILLVTILQHPPSPEYLEAMEPTEATEPTGLTEPTEPTASTELTGPTKPAELMELWEPTEFALSNMDQGSWSTRLRDPGGVGLANWGENKQAKASASQASCGVAY